MPISFRALAVAVQCLLVFGASFESLCAQEIGHPRSVITNGDITTPTLVRDPNDTFEEQQVILKSYRTQLQVKNPEEVACFLPPLSGFRAPTVGVTALATQAKASPEYEKACSAIANKKFDSAEKHLRKALEKFPEYSALWVLLGQVQERHAQMTLARESCLKAATVNSKFVAAYLCLADVAAHSQDWKEVLMQSDRALALEPASSAVSYMFNAGANFNLRNLLGAEKSALRASEIADRDIDPRQLHYLLAEIYEAKGDPNNEIAQLREFVRVAGEGKEAEIVKRYLAKLSSAPGKPAPPADHASK